MKLKHSYMSLVDGGQIIKLKKWESLNDKSFLLKKVKLITGFYGQVGFSQVFRKYDLMIEDPPTLAEKYLRPFSVLSTFGNKIEINNKKLILKEVPSHSILTAEIKVLKNQLAAVLQEATQQAQMTQFLQSPTFKQLQTITNNIEQLSNIFGSKIGRFGNTGYMQTQQGEDTSS